jgi:hypothetical protein
MPVRQVDRLLQPARFIHELRLPVMQVSADSEEEFFHYTQVYTLKGINNISISIIYYFIRNDHQLFGPGDKILCQEKN